MAKHDAYFQFPIHALSVTGKHPNDVTTDEKQAAISRIMYHGVHHLASTKPKWKHPHTSVELASKIWTRQELKKHRIDPDSWGKYFSLDGYPREDDDGYPPPDEWPLEIHIVLAAKRLRFERASVWPQPLPPRPFGSRMVRIRCDLMWDWLGNEANTWREFALLCAVLAACGNNPKRRLSYRQLACMASGFNGIKEFDAATNTTEFQGQKEYLLTVRRVQWTIRKLHERGLFSMGSINKRHNWYSTRMSDEELATELVRKQMAKPPNPRQKTENLRTVVTWLQDLPADAQRQYQDDPAKLRNLVAKAIGRHKDA